MRWCPRRPQPDAAGARPPGGRRGPLPWSPDPAPSRGKRASDVPSVQSGKRGRGGSAVNLTGRWLEGLTHIAALLRAEGAAVLSTSGDTLTTIFAYNLSPETDWRAIFDGDTIDRARAGTTTAASVAAGRWDEQAAYGLVTHLNLPEGEGLLCALRHGVPFDTVELAAAGAAAEL